jgi:serine/threonine protein kinase
MTQKTSDMITEKALEELGYIITGEALEALALKGFFPSKKLGEGCTRDVIELVKLKDIKSTSKGKIQYKKNSHSVKTFKVPKREITNSAYAVINESKEDDTNIKEYNLLKDLSHKNIAKVEDICILSDGRTSSLEGSVNNSCSLKNYLGRNHSEKRIYEVFNQIIGGMNYLNLEKHILHRDFKPDNVIVGKNNGKLEVKIIDFQQAKEIDNINEQVLPTRGSSEYAYPALLNAVISKKKTSASLRTEVYAVGASMLYALDKEAFQNNLHYKLREDDNGVPVVYDGEKVRFSLYKNDSKGLITEKEHEANLGRALKNVPSKYKNIIYKAMTMDKSKAYQNIGEMKTEFDSLNN